MNFSEQDHHWMALALSEAKLAAEQGEVPVGAVVVHGERCIGRGRNAVITLSDPTAHAEVQALREAASSESNYRLPDARLYVTLEPCSMCAGAMVHARISEVIYAAKEPKAGVACSQGHFFSSDFLNHQVKVRGGLMEEESAQLLKNFFKARRKSS